MSVPIQLEPVVGDIDGFNDTFTVTAAYVPGSLRVILNGLAADVSQYNELGGNSFKMVEAPLLGDRIMAYYRPS